MRVHEARKQGKVVLVTCAEGRNRSALVVAEYLVHHRGYAAEKVIEEIQARRDRSLRNEAFVRWLKRSR